MKGLIACDIDGTLTHRLDWIDPKVVQALHEYSCQGWQIALLTGRIFSFAWEILQHFKFPYVLAVQNGADILQMTEKTLLRRSYLSREVVAQIEEAYEGQKEDFIIYAGIDEGDFCYYRPDHFSEHILPYLKKLESLGKGAWQPSDFVFESSKNFPLIKCFGEESAMRRLHATLKENPKIEVSLIRDPVDRNLFLNLITHPDVNKGKAIHYLREKFSPPLVIGAGDDGNDITLLQEADISIAIETAPKNILDEADILASPAEKLGVLEALEEAVSRA